MKTQETKSNSLKFFGFYAAWFLVLFAVGVAFMFLVVTIKAEHALKLLFVLALWAAIHIFTLLELNSNLEGSDSFRQSIGNSWRRSFIWGAVGGLCDLVLAAALFLITKLAPNLSTTWSIVILLGSVFVPPYITFIILPALLYFFSRKTRNKSTS
jgi:hypothetical protein